MSILLKIKLCHLNNMQTCRVCRICQNKYIKRNTSLLRYLTRVCIIIQFSTDYFISSEIEPIDNTQSQITISVCMICKDLNFTAKTKAHS